MGRMYKAVGMKTAANKEGKGVNTLISMGIAVCFPLSTKEIPKDPQKPSANRDQVLGSPTRLSSHRRPGFCCWKEYQNKFQKIPGDFALEVFRGFFTPACSN